MNKRSAGALFGFFIGAVLVANAAIIWWPEECDKPHREFENTRVFQMTGGDLFITKHEDMGYECLDLEFPDQEFSIGNFYCYNTEDTARTERKSTD